MDWTTIPTQVLSGTGFNSVRYFRAGDLLFLRGIIVVNGTSNTRTTDAFKVKTGQSTYNIFPVSLLSNTLAFVPGSGVVKITPTDNGTQFEVTTSVAITYACINAWIEVE